MKIAIPLKKQNDYTELRFALRSIDKFVKGEVLIIGEIIPDWLTNVTWINVKDTEGRRQLSVKNKILAALDYSEEILFSNDDIYWLKKTKVPYYFNGDLKRNGYSGSRELQKELKKMGKPTKSFEVHYPIVFKSDFKDVIKNFSADTMIRSAYCNFLEIDGEQVTYKIDGQSEYDCKFVKSPKPLEVINAINTMDFISTGVYSLPVVKPFLEKLFPNKSKYEI